MPQAVNPDDAAGFTATYQFEVSGSEDFTAHLAVVDGKVSFHEGPAEDPDLIIRTPAEVWLAISRGELDGTQAYMSGQFRIKGDLGMLIKLKTLFGA